MKWADIVKQTIARFARNQSARRGRILLPEEQAAEHARAVQIARRWRKRAATFDNQP
jgi:hypothetical protein